MSKWSPSSIKKLNIIAKRSKFMKILVFITLIYLIFIWYLKRYNKILPFKNFGSKKIKILIYGNFLNRELLPEFNQIECRHSEKFEIIRGKDALNSDFVIISHLDGPEIIKEYSKFKSKKILIMFLWV